MSALQSLSSRLVTAILLLLLLLPPTPPLSPATCRGEDAIAPERPRYAEPTGPTSSLQLMRVAEGFRVELVASEPLVVDPVSICWSGDGSLWVVEMGDYPIGANEGNGGCVKRLVDRDRDGRFDEATVFLKGLNFPTSVLPWRDGLLVAAAPEILFVRDVDGDGKADERRVVLTGFGVSNAQHQVNGLSWGLDNYVHAANGDSGGVVSRPGDEGVDIHGHDIRFRPDAGAVELQSGMSQHTRFRDDWGRWFGGNSAWPLWHDQLPVQYLDRNPGAGEQESCVYLTDPAANPRVYPVSNEQPRLNELEQERRITSACGGCYYRDDRFGPEYLRSVFVCDPANNLLHHRTLRPTGATFAAVRPAAPAELSPREFLSSRDTWFRPVQATTGPDGALYIVDMYRLIIEHPDYFERSPASLKTQRRGQTEIDGRLKKLLRRGAARGRIYRVVRDNGRPRPALQLAGGSVDDLVRELQSRNGVRRDIAHRQLVSRGERRAAGRIESLTRHGEPRVRVQALAALNGVGSLPSPSILNALRDPEAEVRRFALKLAESRLQEDSLYAAVSQLATDKSPAVRLQATLTLGECDRKEVGDVLGAVALRHVDNPTMVAAVLSARPRHTEMILKRVIEGSPGDDATLDVVAGLLQTALRNDDARVLAMGLNSLAPLGESRSLWRLRVLGAFLKSMDHASLRWTELAAVDERLAESLSRLKPVFSTARRDAGDSTALPTLRVASIRLLGRGAETRNDAVLLGRLLLPTEPLEVQRAAVGALATIGSPHVAEVFLDEWRQRGPETRRAIVKAMLDRRQWTMMLLKAIDARRVSGSQLSPAQRERLVLHYYRDVRAEAKRVFGEPIERGSELGAAYARRAMELKGNADRGAALFLKHCSVCHLDPPKRSAGPPLSLLTQASKLRIVESVVFPSRVVEPAYASYSVVTQAGRVLHGVIRRETALAIEIIDSEGRATLLLRADIEELLAGDTSLMPDQLRRVLVDPQDLADIVAALGSPVGAERIRQAAKSTR